MSDEPKDKRQGKDVGRVGKETVGKRNGSKLRVNGNDGVKPFWGTCFVCGEQAIRRTAVRFARRVTRSQLRSFRVRPLHSLLAFQLELGFVLHRRPRRPFHKVLPAGRALLLPGNRLCHIGPFRWEPKRRKKGMLIKCRDSLTYAWNILKCFVRSWLGRRRTTHMRRPG